MSLRRIRARVAPPFLLAALCCMLAAACGGDDGDGGNKPSPAPMPSSIAPGSTMASIVQRGKLVVGVKYDVPLFGLRDPVSRQVDGFDVALAREIAKALGLREDQVQLVEANSAERIPLLQDDSVDIVVSTMTINAQRKELVDFSRPYYLAGQSVMVRQDTTTIASVDDLNGRRVCSAAGSTSEMNIQEKAPRAVLTSLPTYSICVTALNDGRVDAVSTDDVILAGFAASDRGLKVVGGLFTTEPYGVGIKKGKADMVAFVNDVIGQMLRDGRWEQLYNQYLGNVSGFPSAAEAKSKLPAQ